MITRSRKQKTPVIQFELQRIRQLLKVAKQLHNLINKQEMKLNFILNKYNGENNFIPEFELEFADLVIGKINYRYSFDQL
ncbi:MAG: hypothetical protein HC785_06415 [Calothrix sp. CSU_2_0]|nr:hypothetical protein [Calothrix sp. CSU_2_0]